MKRFVLILFLTFPAILFAGDGLPDQPYLYVEGKGELEKPADLVTLRFDLVVRGPDQAKANQEVQSKAAKIFSLLDERKISKADVIASDLRSEAQFQEDPNSPGQRGKVIGYVVTRPFAMKVRDVTTYGKLIDDLIALGGVEISGVEPGLAKEKELKDEVLSKALADARAQAEKTLDPMGMKIASVFAVSPVTFPEIIRTIFGSGGAIPYAASAPASRMVASEYRLAPITITQRIHVIYLIAPAR